jgi:hypothetical protein
MSNANEPAFPAYLKLAHEFGIGEAHMPGQTKREHFALESMKAILGNKHGLDWPSEDALLQNVPRLARLLADELLAELERTA